MKSRSWAKILGVVALAGALVLGGEPAFATGGGSYTCNGGDIPSGTYRTLTVAGQCSVAADAAITVRGNVTVRKGAALDAQSAPSTIKVRGSVTAMPGSMLGLGCQPASYTQNSAHPCVVEPKGHSMITIGGEVTALGGAVVLLNGVTVQRSVTVLGGGSAYIPWSIKNNTIRGNVTVIGQTTNWIGVLFNKVGGSVTLLKIVITDTDPGAPGVYVGHNTITRNLICAAITPGVSEGFGPTAANVVGGHAFGQCSGLV